jgi:PAS domain S-box-containing protein
VSSKQPADLCRALIEQVADAVIFADRDGLIQLWNAGAEAVFGYAPDEVLGRRLDVLIPERLRSAHWTAFDKAIATGRTKHGRESVTTRSIHKNGSDLYVDLSFAVVKDQAGRVLGSVAVARDITSRFQTDRESRRRIAELEAQVKTFAPDRS